MIGRLEEIEKTVRGGKTRPTVQYVAPVAAPEAALDPAAEQNRQILAQRYGVDRGIPGRGAAPTAPTTPTAPMVQLQPTATPAPQINAADIAAEIAQLPFSNLAEGSWRDEEGRLTLSLRPEREMSQFVVTRRTSDLRASVREERLYLTDRGQTLVMARF
jgi:hypothetical protein